MKRKALFGSLFLCCSGLMMAQEVSTDSLSQTVMNDSVVEVAVDSTAVALRPLTLAEVDSASLEQVKAVAEMIADQSLVDAQLVQTVFSDTAIVNKYNRVLDEMVAKYAAEVENISATGFFDIKSRI